jgi:hypothetical protein
MHNILVVKPEGKRPPTRHRCRWEDTVKMGLREIGFEGVDWIHLAQVRNHWWALVKIFISSSHSKVFIVVLSFKEEQQCPAYG